MGIVKEHFLKLVILIMVAVLVALQYCRSPDHMIATSRNAVALSCAVAAERHDRPGVVFSGTFYSYLIEHAEKVGDFEVISDKTLEKVLSFPLNYRENDLQIVLGDDLGLPLFYTLAVGLFGLKISSLVKMAGIIMLFLTGAFLLRFRQSRGGDLWLLAYVITIPLFIPEGFTSKNSYGAHGLPYLALLATFYWIYSFFHTLDHERRPADWGLDLSVGFLYAVFILCRTTVKIQLAGVALTALLFFFRNRKELGGAWRKTGEFFSPLLIIIGMTLALQGFSNASLHPKYGDMPREHTFWHTVYVGLGVYPNKYDILFEDTVGLEHARLSKYNLQGDRLRIYSKEYEEILKKETLDIIKKDPAFIGDVFLKKIYLIFYMFYESYPVFLNPLFLLTLFLGVLSSVFVPHVFARPFKGLLVLPGLLLFVEPLLAHPLFNKEVLEYFTCYFILLLLNYVAAEFSRLRPAAAKGAPAS